MNGSLLLFPDPPPNVETAHTVTFPVISAIIVSTTARDLLNRLDKSFVAIFGSCLYVFVIRLQNYTISLN